MAGPCPASLTPSIGKECAGHTAVKITPVFGA
jgi:hypothetical protein